MKRYFILLLLGCSVSSVYGKDLITIHTYTSFISPLYGPGTQLKEIFEKQNPDIEIKYVATDTLPILLNRLRLEGKRTKADLVLGLEDLVMDPVLFEKTVPYASCCLAFTYDAQKIPQPPQSLEALIQSSHKIILQDPRTSVTGFGFLVWMKKVYGEKAPEKWKTLAAHVLTFTKGWSDSALLFKKGEAPILLSYTTDALYHELTEGHPQFKAMVFSEGHLCSQIYAAKIKVTQNSALADKFIAFLLTPEAQSLIAVKGWGYPVSGEIPDSWLKSENYLPPPGGIPFTPEEVSTSSKKWLQEWIDGLIK